MQRLCVFEDLGYRHFFPFTKLRPVCAIRAGLHTLLDGLRHGLPEHEVGVHCREELITSMQEHFPEIAIHQPSKNNVGLFINGRIRPDETVLKTVRALAINTVVVDRGAIALACLQGEALTKMQTALKETVDTRSLLATLPRDIQQITASVRLYDHPWEIIADLKALMVCQTKYRPGAGLIKGTVHSSAQLIADADITIGEGSQIGPLAVLDASGGPIVIGAHCTIEALAFIQGPAALGDHCVVKSHTQMRAGTTLGPGCKIGGEIANTVMLGYSNKGHEGFVGDSMIGSWVNLGAGTTTSNMKNNYGTVRCQNNQETHDTGLQFLGSQIGDYSKTGIGTLLPTGAVVGLCCNTFGGGLAAKTTPDFTWGPDGKRYDFDKAWQSACRMAERRGRVLSDHDRILLKNSFD